MPRKTQGTPRRREGRPSGSEGIPRKTQGTPRGREGRPSGSEGIPRRQEGRPSGIKWTPRQAEERPCDTQGTPREARGLPWKPQGTPRKWQGCRRESKGTPREARQAALFHQPDGATLLSRRDSRKLAGGVSHRISDKTPQAPAGAFVRSGCDPVADATG